MNIVLVGAGKISKKYIKAFNYLDIKVVAIVDLNDQPFGASVFKDIPIYKSINEVENKNIDYCLVSTPPKSHFNIIKEILLLGYNVLVEKPGVTNNYELEELIIIKNNLGLSVKTMFHWRYADEILLALNKVNVNKFHSINIFMDEPYATNYKLDENIYNNGGIYLDSHINILSFLDLFLDIDELVLINKKEEYDKANLLIVRSEIKYKYKDSFIHINYDWTKSTNLIKQTFITLQEGKLVKIDHLNQKLEINGDIFSIDTIDRLEDHYLNLFKNIKEIDEIENQVKIYKKLFEII